MKLRYLFVILAFTSCVQHTKEKKPVVNIEEAVEAQEAFRDKTDLTSTSKKVDFNQIISKFKIRTTPIIDSTNFDNFKGKDFFSKEEVSALKLQKLYPNYYKEGYNYKATASYKVELSSNFHSIVITILKGENEMESVLLTYSREGNLLDSEIVSYDEIAEGWLQITSKIETHAITINYISWVTDEKTVETSNVEVDANGIIKHLSQDDMHIRNVLQQLKIDRSKVMESLIVAKGMPNDLQKTIIVIPEYATTDNDAYDFELNSHIIILNNETGKITNTYFESSKTNQWVSDAVELKALLIDTAPYKISEKQRAFGIRVRYSGMSRANPYNYETISLFVKNGTSLDKVLDNYTMAKYTGEWDTNCAGEFMDEKKTLHILDTKTNTYFDMEVNNSVTNIKNFINDDGECDTNDKVSTLKTVLTFNKEAYQ